MTTRTAIIAGATGLVGGHLLERLLADARYNTVTSLVRRRTGREHAKLVEQVIDFDALASLALPSADDLYCALGTTIKVAGSREAFTKVDRVYVHELARAGVRAGVRRFLVVSSLGADASSKIFYSRVKGEMEEAVSREPYEAVHIFRPSIIAGDRREPRFGERLALAVMGALSAVMVGPLRRYRPIHADAIAAAMIAAATSPGGGVSIHDSEEITALAQARPST